MNNNLIYALYCPINKIPVYIGQSSVGINRPFTHIKERSHSKKVNDWVNSLSKVNLQPVLVVLESDFKDDYLNPKEQYWIYKYLNDGNILLNQKNVSCSFYLVKEFDIDTEKDLLFEIRMFIKAKRKMLKMTQMELSQKAGVGIRFIRELEQGTKNNFNTGSIDKVLKLFGNIVLSINNV